MSSKEEYSSRQSLPPPYPIQFPSFFWSTDETTLLESAYGWPRRPFLISFPSSSSSLKPPLSDISLDNCKLPLWDRFFHCFSPVNDCLITDLSIISNPLRLSSIIPLVGDVVILPIFLSFFLALGFCSLDVRSKHICESKCLEGEEFRECRDAILDLSNSFTDLCLQMGMGRDFRNERNSRNSTLDLCSRRTPFEGYYD